MPKNPSQPGELGAEDAKLDAAAIKEQLADIRDKVENQKIPLTNEVEVYTRENLRKVAGKLQAGEPVYPSDMEFIGKVKLWMEMPPDLRNRYRSIEEMEGAEEMEGVTINDLKKRSVNLRQWLLIMHMARIASVKGKEKEWIDAFFEFPGNGEIRRHGSLDLSGSADSKILPENLWVGGDLQLRFCTNLIALPENLKVEGNLLLDQCASLTSLPDSLEVGMKLFITRGLNEQVEKDAEKLKKEGKIKGKIVYK